MLSDVEILGITQPPDEEVITGPEEIPIFKKNKKRMIIQAQIDNLIKGRATLARIALIRKTYNDELRAEKYKATTDRIINNARNIMRQQVREVYESNLKYPPETMTDEGLKRMIIANHNFKNQVII